MVKQSNSKPPIAKLSPKNLEIHSHSRIDNYYWMNDRENPEVIAYLKQENEYKESCLAADKPLREKLFKEMKSRIKEDDSSVPYFKNGFYYYQRFEEGKEYPIYCRKKEQLNGEEQIILNVNELAEGKEYLHVNALAVSESGNLLAFACDEVGRRIYTIHFKDLRSGEMIGESIKAITGNMAWASDDKTLFYSQQDPETLRSNRVYKHLLGQQQSEDELVFEEKDEKFTLQVKKSKSGKFLFISSQSTISSEYRFLPADKPDRKWKLIQKRAKDLEYEVEHYEDFFIILTNADGAKNFKLVKAP